MQNLISNGFLVVVNSSARGIIIIQADLLSAQLVLANHKIMQNRTRLKTYQTCRVYGDPGANNPPKKKINNFANLAELAARLAAGLAVCTQQKHYQFLPPSE